MRLTIKKGMAQKTKTRLKRKLRIRKKISGTAERPRFCVYRSANYLYAQIIDDVAGKTLLSVSTKKFDEKSKKNVEAAKKLGADVAKEAQAKNINDVVFDRNGFLYHGKIKAIADGAREGGLKF